MKKNYVVHSGIALLILILASPSWAAEHRAANAGAKTVKADQNTSTNNKDADDRRNNDECTDDQRQNDECIDHDRDDDCDNDRDNHRSDNGRGHNDCDNDHNPVVTPTTLNWPHYGNRYNNQRFQNVDQINPANVANLKVSWVFHTGVLDPFGGLELSPIVINGVMYATSAHDDVFAIDAVAGTPIWAYHPADMPPPETLPLCCGRNNRGVAVGGGRVYVGRLDANVVALDQNTGTVVWEQKLADSAQGYSITVAPQYVTTRLHPNGLVIISLSGGEFEARGQVFALDATTGEPVWLFFTTRGPETWGGPSYLTGGAFVWNTPSIDPRLDLLYVNTGNAAPDVLGQNRPGINLFSCSLVALNIDTGNEVWYFQEVHHDIWDYDAAQTTVLFDFSRGDGRQIPAIAHTGKSGETYILDRRNGHPLFAVREEPVPSTEPEFQHPWPTQPHSSVQHLTPEHFVRPNLSGIPSAPQYTPPSPVIRMIVPGAQGGGEWVAAAYSPRTQFFYNPVRYEPTSYVSHPDNQTPIPVPGQIPPEFVGSDFGRSVITTFPFGIFGAVDTTTGTIAWKNETPDLATSDMTVTGDLVWYGQDNGKLNAVDARTGALLFTFDGTTIPGAGGANAGAVAYVVNGKEYISYAFGGNFLERGNQQTDPVGDAIVTFSLP